MPWEDLTCFSFDDLVISFLAKTKQQQSVSNFHARATALGKELELYLNGQYIPCNMSSLKAGSIMLEQKRLTFYRAAS